MDQGAVKNDASLLIAVQTFIKEVMDDAARLRDAEDAGLLNRPRQRIVLRRLVPEKRHAVPQGGEA